MPSVVFWSQVTSGGVDWKTIKDLLVVLVPLIIVVIQWVTKNKVNEIHVMVNAEHTQLVKALAEANQKIDRLIGALPFRKEVQNDH